MKNTKVIEHPVMSEKLARLRNKDTTTSDFRRTMHELSILLAYECTHDLKLTDVEIETPITKAKVKNIGEDLIVSAIMRAGNGMLDAFMDILPFARAGHIGIYRDKFIDNTVEYYFKLPENSENSRVILLDPLVATGSTVIASVERLIQYGVGRIQLATILISEHAIERIHKYHPNLEIVCVSIEKETTKDGYLVPGMGDAGNRLFGTK